MADLGDGERANFYSFTTYDHMRAHALTSSLPRRIRVPTGNRGRDRHGRGLRGPLLFPALPRWATRREQFHAEVTAALAEIASREPQIATIEFGIEDVPPSNPATWEEHDVILARVFPRDKRRGLADRIVIYRHPILHRTTAADLPIAIRIVLAERISEVLDVAPEFLLFGND